MKQGASEMPGYENLEVLLLVQAYLQGVVLCDVPKLSTLVIIFVVIGSVRGLGPCGGLSRRRGRPPRSRWHLSG